MAVIGQSHSLLSWMNRVPDHSYHSNTIVRTVPTEVGLSCTCTLTCRYLSPSLIFSSEQSQQLFLNIVSLRGKGAFSRDFTTV